MQPSHIKVIPAAHCTVKPLDWPLLSQLPVLITENNVLDWIPLVACAWLYEIKRKQCQALFPMNYYKPTSLSRTFRRESPNDTQLFKRFITEPHVLEMTQRRLTILPMHAGGIMWNPSLIGETNGVALFPPCLGGPQERGKQQRKENLRGIPISCLCA